MAERCAYRWCQADRDLLPNAPRVKMPTEPWIRNGDLVTHDTYHPGCWAKMTRARVLDTKCSHYTPAEDKSGFAYAHRTYGCPDEGAEWPSAWHGDLEEFRHG